MEDIKNLISEIEDKVSKPTVSENSFEIEFEEVPDSVIRQHMPTIQYS